MAIDKDKTRELIDDIDKLFDSISKPLPKETKKFLKKKVMGPVFDEVRKLIEESRPPVLFLMGRSGHGKSSLLNALANSKVAEVGDIKPTTPESVAYEINFKDRYANWSVIDTRGIFETTKPDGALGVDAIEILKKDIIKYKSDSIIHIINASITPNLSNNLKVSNDTTIIIRKEAVVKDFTNIAVNKEDSLGNIRDLLLEKSVEKSDLTKNVLNFMVEG